MDGAIFLVDWVEDENGLTGILEVPLGLPKLFLRRALQPSEKAMLYCCVENLSKDGYSLVASHYLKMLKLDQRKLWMGRVRSAVATDFQSIGGNLRVTHDDAFVEELDIDREFSGADWFLVKRV